MMTSSYESDPETDPGNGTGNDYAFARYYSPRLGRFLSADPWNGDLSDPQTLNRYAYTRNNPVNLSDPSGMILGPPNYGDMPDFWGFTDLGTFTIIGEGQCDISGPCAPNNYIISPAPPPPTPAQQKQKSTTPPPQKKGWLSRLVNAVICAVTQPLQDAAVMNQGVTGVGVGGSAGIGVLAGVSIQGSVQVVADPNGNVGVALTGGGNPGFGVIGIGAIVGGQYSTSNAQTIFAQRGQSFSFGVSAGSGIGGEVDISASYPSGTPATTTYTVGLAAGTKATGFAITGTAVPSSLSTTCPQ